VRGPTSVSSASADAHVLGMKMYGREVFVRKGKVLPFECFTKATFVAHLGRGGEAKVCHEALGTRIWSSVRNAIEMHVPRSIMLFGGNDTGKSTLATYVANVLLQDGKKVWMVDGDLGQGDLSPPTCMGATVIRSPVSDLRDLKADRIVFVGVISPSSFQDLVINGLKELACASPGVPELHVIVNTDGFVEGNGVEYKLRLATAIRPDMLVTLGSREEDLHKRLLATYGPEKVILAERPKGITKDYYERAERRMLQYWRFLEDTKKIRIHLQGTVMSFAGISYYGPTYIHPSRVIKKGQKGWSLVFERSSLGTVVVERSSRKVRFPWNRMQGLFVGVGAGQALSGFGIIDEMRPDGSFVLRTPVRRGPDSIYLSTVRLIEGLKRESVLKVLEA